MKRLFVSMLLVHALLIPTPVPALTWLGGKAKITSCAQMPRDEAKPAPYHRANKLKGQAPMPTGSGAVNMAQPAPTSIAPPAMEAEASSDSKSDRSRASEPKQGKSEDKLDRHQAGKKVSKEVARASSLYLSNDDSMSLASAQRLIYAINNFLPVYRNEIRPHEFLNYFHFKTQPVLAGETFSVNFQTAPREKGQTLALAVQGRKLTREDRQQAVITLVVDKSGSMSSQGKMEYLKMGLETMKGQLKDGDVVNVVEFDHEICNAIEGFIVGRDGWKGYDQTVAELAPRGSTDLHGGLVEGYKLAERFYQPGKLNRVILITDAIANTGTLSPELMASIGKYYDTQKIALSGIGVGLDFNDELLDTLTDQGKGAYLFLGIKEAIPRVFGSEFVSLLETVARNVHFQASFPKDLHLEIFYGEEVSTQKEKVQPIHYFANTSQLFLLDLAGKVVASNPQFSLKIEFESPRSGEKKVETLTRNLAMIQENGQDNVAKARLIMTFADLLEKTALSGNRPYGGWTPRRHGGVQNAPEGKKLCEAALATMKTQSTQFSDTETQYIMGMAGKYCSRF